MQDIPGVDEPVGRHLGNHRAMLTTVTLEIEVTAEHCIPGVRFGLIRRARFRLGRLLCQCARLQVPVAQCDRLRMAHRQAVVLKVGCHEPQRTPGRLHGADRKHALHAWKRAALTRLARGVRLRQRDLLELTHRQARRNEVAELLAHPPVR